MNTEKTETTLEEIKTIIHMMVEALDDYASICHRLDAQPMYGRDAAILGVEDGFCVAPSDYELSNAKSKAYDACYEAQKAGLIKEIPYYIR